VRYNEVVKRKKDLTSFLILKYRKMSGDKKIRIAMDLSKAVREFRKIGRLATGA